ncbi:MAG: PLDc_N domain-containing protein [Anaerolineales bacterium]|nr:PLDc_N domain-containing protein [Anaerolineales bacterium]
MNLRKRNIEETAKAVWVLVILLLPIVGPATYFLMNNEKRDDEKKDD